MYNNPAPIAGAGGLAATGLTGNLLWLLLAAFALVAMGLSLLRTIPKREA
jgi:hypothetical protein